jgi:hypothetical protein
MADRFLFRDYTGSEPGFVQELVVYSTGGVTFAVIPVPAKKAMQDGLVLVATAAAEMLGNGAKANP